MARHVKGSLFVEYVRMIRKLKDRDWDQYLTAEDREVMAQMILPSGWYPLETYQRMGIAVLHEIAGAKMETVRAWGRMSTDEILNTYKTMIVEGEPVETLKKFQVLRNRFLDFEGLAVEPREGKRVRLNVDVPFNDKLADEACAFQMLGSFERLIELSGARNVRHEFVKKLWEGDPISVIEFSWE